MNVELPHLWTPRLTQVPIWNFFFPDPRRKRAVVVAHRRFGKDLLALNLLTTVSQQIRATYWHLFPFFAQGRSIVWNGIDVNNGRAFMDYIPESLVESKSVNEMRVVFKNGSIYQIVGSDNIDRLVGTNPFGVVISEWSLCDPKVFDYLRPILRENSGFALFIYTIRGRNHGYRLAKKAEKLVADEISAGGERRWFYANHTVKDSVRPDGTRYVTEADIDQDRKEGMSEAMIQQEYYNSPDSPLEGAYYGSEMDKALKEGRICDIKYEPKIPVETAWDIGVRDSTSIIFFQRFDNEIRIIDYYENSGEGLRHYVKLLQSKDYLYKKHYGPHDITVREWTGGNSRLEAARHMGVKFTVTQRHDVSDGIEQVRSVLPRCIFNGTACERLIDALRAYRKDRAPDTLAYAGEDGVTPIFKDEPLHDWSSHAASAMDTLCWNNKTQTMIGDEKWPKQERAVDNFEYC